MQHPKEQGAVFAEAAPPEHIDDACCCARGHEHPCDHPQDRRGWPARLLAFFEVGALAAVAAFLAYASLTERVRLFVAPAYIWLPAAAAVLLGLMTLARFWVAMKGAAACGCEGHAAPWTRSLLCGALLAPVAFGLSVDPRQFSSEGLQKRRAPVDARDARIERAMNWILTGTLPASRAASTGTLPSDPTVVQLLDAMEEGHAEAWAGRFVTVIGQCEEVEGPDLRFGLYRLIVTCCVADAQAVAIEVVAPAGTRVAALEWARVSGMLKLEEDAAGGRLVLHATTVEKIPVPASPYL